MFTMIGYWKTIDDLNDWDDCKFDSCAQTAVVCKIALILSVYKTRVDSFVSIERCPCVELDSACETVSWAFYGFRAESAPAL